jgi:hypothetical protein
MRAAPDQDGVLDEFDPESHDLDFDLTEIASSPESRESAVQNHRLLDKLIKSGELRRI